MSFLWLSVNRQPGAKRVLNQPRRGGGWKGEESLVYRLKWAKETELARVIHCSRRAQVDGTAGQVRKRERFMYCANKRPEEKSPIRLGSSEVKETSVHTVKEWSGKTGWKQSSEGHLLTWDSMPSRHGTNPVLQEATQWGQDQPGQETMPGRGIKVTWASWKKLPGEFTSKMWSRVETQSFLLWELGKPAPLGLSMKQECREVVHQMPVASTRHFSRGCCSAPPGFWSGELSAQGSCCLGGGTTEPQELVAQVRQWMGSGLWPWKATRWGIGEASQRSTERQGEMRAGTGNDLALMGSTPHWNKGRHEWGFALKKPAVARSFQY